MAIDYIIVNDKNYNYLRQFNFDHNYWDGIYPITMKRLMVAYLYSK